MTLSSLIASAENFAGPPISRTTDQPVWRDPDTGLTRIMVSPLNTGSRMELVHVELPGGAQVQYDPLREPHYDQYVYVLQGRPTMTFGQETFALSVGDCLRSRFDVPHAFANRGRNACRYLVAIGR